MSTFVQMRAVIADDLDRSDMTTQINRAINRAIKHYEKEPFWFKETTGTFSCVASQKTYTSSAIPTDIKQIDRMEVVVNSNDQPLKEVTLDEIEDIDYSHQTGIPDRYAYYSNSIYLYPIPNSTYTVRVFYTKKYTELSSDSDTNDWTTEAEDLIEARAEWYIYKKTLKDKELAADCKEAEIEALTCLRAKSADYQGLNADIVPTEF